MSSPRGNAERAPGGGRHFFAENLKIFAAVARFRATGGKYARVFGKVMIT